MTYLYISLAITIFISGLVAGCMLTFVLVDRHRA